MKPLVSLVVPVYFEEEVILHFIQEVHAVISSLPNYTFEIVFVDDGSKDKTVELIQDAILTFPYIRLVVFSYNHGKQAAISAAIAHAKGDYLIYMDPDLQDPPYEIPRLIAKIEEGYDCVFGIRKEKVDNLINRLYSKIFWGFLNTYTGLQIPKGLAVYRIFNRKFANAFLQYREQNRFIEGIFMHIAQKYTTLEVDQKARFAGTSKFNFKRKMQLAWNAIFDFSERPLRLAVTFGIGLSILGVLGFIAIAILKVSFINFQAGWASIISAIILGSGIQLFFLGIVALYVGKIYREVKMRPLYSIQTTYNCE